MPPRTPIWKGYPRSCDTPVPGLLHCGDSTFPGIGLPSAAASGMNAANTLVSPLEQLALLQEIEDVRKQ